MAAGEDHALAIRPLREFLDTVGLGSGPVEAERIGGGHSNLTFRVRRGEDTFVLRRPPLGKLAPSANDVLREARVLAALGPTAVPAPRVLATCDDPSVIGASFLVITFAEGEAIADELPSDLSGDNAAKKISRALIATLADLHAVDLGGTGLSALARPSGYLERQLGRFTSLLADNASRALPQLEAVGRWLRENLPDSDETTLVHGDYRLGNLLYVTPSQVSAVLDWEMATIGDPLADLGYCTAVWAEPGDEENPMLAAGKATRHPSFPRRGELADHYAALTGRSIEGLPWYQILALWKAAIFLEGSYARYLAGDSEDPFFATLDVGVPKLARAAMQRIRAIEPGFEARIAG